VKDLVFYDGHKVYMNGYYPAIWLENRSVHVHRLEWEKHFGAIPDNCIIHHKDENKMNWNIDNLELLSRDAHIRTHKNIVHRKGVKIIGRKNAVEKQFESIEQAAIICGTYPCSVRRVFKGEQKSANGWTFERLGGYNSVL
jgi:hypothetical protein